MQATTIAPKQSFLLKDETEAGLITIRELTKSDVPEASRILVECFNDVLGYGKSFKWFLRKAVEGYLKDCIKSNDSVFVLVAELQPNENWQDPTENDDSYVKPMFQSFNVESINTTAPATTAPSGPMTEKTTTSIFSEFREEIDGKEPQSPPLILNQSDTEDNGVENEMESSCSVDSDGSSLLNKAQSGGRLIGTIEVSIADSSRSFCFLLSPPPTAAYICNMAVDPIFRRQGHATRLLQAAETIVKNSKVPDIYLHLLVDDLVAGKLYSKFGYEVERTHPFFVWFFGQDRKHLMKKSLIN
eukprot:g5402.t1